MARKSSEFALELASSPFWLRKIRTAFQAYDTTQDGVMSVDDIIVVAKRFGKKCPERAEEIMETMTGLWTTSAGGKRDAKFDVKSYIDTRITYSLRPDAKSMFRAYSDAKFNIIDLDRSNFISQKEFTDYFECMGIDTKHAPASFKALDTNGDGTISRDEFLDAAVEFAFGLKEGHPSELFYGPLVD